MSDSGEIQRPLNAQQRTEETEPLGWRVAKPDRRTVAAPVSLLASYGDRVEGLGAFQYG